MGAAIYQLLVLGQEDLVDEVLDVHIRNTSSQLVEDIGVAVINGTTVAGIPWTSWIARIAGVADVSKIPEVLIDDHVFVELADIFAAEPVNVRAVQLTDRGTIQLVHVSPFVEADGVSVGIVDVVAHS